MCIEIINKTNNLINVNRDDVVDFNESAETNVISMNFSEMLKKSIFELKFNRTLTT